VRLKRQGGKELSQSSRSISIENYIRWPAKAGIVAATMRLVFQKIVVFVSALAVVCGCAAQEQPAAQQPKVKVNVLNVCTPSADEQQEISAALGRVPKRPAFSADYEVDRGRSVLDQGASVLAAANIQVPADSTSADFVRIRREISGAGAYSTVQYSFSRDTRQMVETLVFRVHDPKDLLQVSIEDSASAVTPAAAMLNAATPVSRIKLERFGKSSVVLARCQAQEGGAQIDQSKYDPLFASATSIMGQYRGLLGARKMVPEELLRIGAASKPATTAKGKGPASPK